MLFNSLIFLVFLPLVFTGYWLLPNKYRNSFLLIASYFFYFNYNPWFVLLLLGTSVFDYWCARQIAKHPHHKKQYLMWSILSNVGVLFVFKYLAFTYNTCVGIISVFNEQEWQLMHQLIIPAGLSFYTFQSLSYTIDVYRGKYKPTDSWQEFLLYVSFFPHMVAGPIVRYNDLMPQFKIRQYFKSIDWGAFIKLCIWGYFKKIVIADNLSDVVTPIFNHVENYSGATLLIAGFLFVVQVYCDFSGYSDIATGVAKLFGINLSLNWRRPLLSSSLIEFWTRNHISITNWFRDYLYIGLGGNRVTYVRWLINIFLVFLISGLWHGANFTFIVWGSMHGVFYITELLLKKYLPAYKAPKLLGWLYLIMFHTFSLIAFRALSIHDLKLIYTSIFSHFELSNIYSQLNSVCDGFQLVLYVGFILLLFLKELKEEFINLNHHFIYKEFTQPLFYILLLISIVVFGNFNANEFIYFQF